MSSRISTKVHTVRKSQLAGFFLLALSLSACQPAADYETQLIQRAATDATAAEKLARLRLANDELAAALLWWQQAARLKAPGALQHALQLQLRLEGKLATTLWLAEHPELLKSAELSVHQLAELGFWSTEASPITNKRLAVPSAEMIDCRLTIQPVISYASAERDWQRLLVAWQEDPQLSQLPVCFQPVHRVAASLLQCTESRNRLIRCDYRVLTELVQQADFQQLLVIAGRGIANFNNGIIQLPEQASLALLRHEFMHIAGFLDEYALAPVTAKAVCQPGRIAPNLIIGQQPATIEQYRQRYGHLLAELEFTEVSTCDAVGLQAYRPLAATNTMRYFEAPLPEGYFQLLQYELQQSQQFMPVQYYFAYLARQQEAWTDWLVLLQGAAALGYPAAVDTLSQPIFTELGQLTD